MADKDTTATPVENEPGVSTSEDTDKARADVAAEAKKSGVKEDAAPVGVQSITVVMPAEADKTSVPNSLDAKSEEPPVRAARPDSPIAQTLAAGAGEHTPPDPAEFDSAGRPK